MQPHRLQTGTLGERERQLRTFGTIVLAFFLLVYFVVVPASFTGASYETSIPSFYLFVCMDIVILIRVLANRRDAWSVRWSWVYTWLAVAAAFILTGDLVELASHVGLFTLPSATLLDLICGKTKASAGSIKFKDEELTKMSEHAIVRSGIGRQFQTPSIYENLNLRVRLLYCL